MPSILAEKKSDTAPKSIAGQNTGNAGSSMAAVPALQKKEVSQEELQMKAIQLKKDTLQRKELGNEEELPVQGKFTIQKQSDTEEEPLQMMPFQLKTDLVQKAAIPEEELSVQGKFQTIQKKENKTGLPDNLKSGVENLSGFSMDDVKVHYNSSQPAQLNALAYAQGTDIHVAPGQEQHLPHEAWHVAQQKQGRVQPTMQMKAGVAVNDDPGLENEADVMGAKAIQTKSYSSVTSFSTNNISLNAVQRYPIAKVSSTQVASQSGRPSARSNKSTIQGIIARIYQIGPMNDLETLLKNFNNKSKAVDEVHSNNFLSKNGAAICHKQAISVIEKQFVAYANLVLNNNNSTILDQQAITLVKDLTQLDNLKQGNCLSYLESISDIHTNSGPFADKAADVATYLDYLILELDGSFSNLYIGYSNTNSSVGDHFDAHYDVNSTTDPSATPVGTSIYYSQKDLGDGLGIGHSSPRRINDGTDLWNETSGVPNKGYIAYDQNKDKYL
jgi:hypothetical protein